MRETRTPPGNGEQGDVLDAPGAGGVAVRGGALRVGAYLAGVLLSVASAALLFRHLGVVDSGRYVTVVSLVAIAQGLTDAGISALGIRELSVRDGAARERLLRAIAGLRMLLTFAGVLAAVGFSALAGYGATLTLGTAIAGLGLMVSNHQATLAIALQARLELVWVAVADMLRQIATVAAIVALVVAGAEILPFFAIPILASGVALAYTAAKLRAHTAIRPSIDTEEWRRLLRDTIPFAVATAVYALYFRIAIILLSLVSSEEELGYFGAAFRIVEVLVLVPGLAISAVFPILARAGRDDSERLAYAVDRTFAAALGFGGALAIGLLAGAPFAIDVVAGARFAPAAGVLQILAVALAAAFVSQAFGYALLSIRKHGAILAINLISLAAAAALTLLLAADHGARGAAVAVALGEVVSAVVSAVAFARALPDSRPVTRTLLRMALATAAGLGVAAIPGVPAVVLAVLAMSAYLAVLWVLGGIPDEIVTELRRRIRRAAKEA